MASRSSPPIPREWIEPDLPLALLPLNFLVQHVQDVSRTLASLKNLVLLVEEEVASCKEITTDQPNFKDLIGRLHRYDTGTIKLHRRWHFQCMLANAICELVELHNLSAAVNQKSQIPTVNSDVQGDEERKVRLAGVSINGRISVFGGEAIDLSQ